jgi:tetratricopeptide (TPR) repeat protein
VTPADVQERARPSVALCVLVRDEATIVERCFESAITAIDSWVIVDTGSLDATPRIVRRFQRTIPGVLHHRPWRDFGTNRTELLQLARGAADYLLLLDADQTIGLDKELPALEADAYELLQVEDPQIWVPRLVRAGLPWRFVGATHERLVCDVPVQVGRLEGVEVHHHLDGSSRQDNPRKAQLALERQLLSDPTDPHTVFSLAQTYRDLRRPEAAIAMYERRLELCRVDGEQDQDERFYATYQAAALTARTDPAAGTPMLVAAWEQFPDRAEPLYEAALACRLRSDHARALELLETAAPLPLPEDRQWVHRWIYEWGIPLEHAISLAHAERVEDALRIVDGLLDRSGLPAWLDVDVLLMRQWLEDRVGSQHPVTTAAPDPRRGERRLDRPRRLEELVGPVPAVCLAGELDERWAALNPSVAATPDGFGVLLRAVNWRYRDDTPDALETGRYVRQCGDAYNRNRTLLQLHDAAGEPRARIEIKEPHDRPRTAARIRGFEDCRLFWWRGAWHVIACVVDATAEESFQMSIARIDGDRFTDFHLLLGPERGRHEKNWMPFVVGDRLLLVYGCHPFVVLEWDPDVLELHEVQRIATPAPMAGLRGGSQGLPVDDGYVFVLHEMRAPPSELRRLYVHRLLKINSALEPVGLSKPFVFQRYGIEFCAGIADAGEDLLLSYGLQDSSAWLTMVPRHALLDLLEPIPRVIPLAPPPPELTWTPGALW